MSVSRQKSYKIIYDVKYNVKYSNILLLNELNDFSSKDRAFITYITYGVLSKINRLDYIIKKYSNIAFSKISKQARVILEIAIFEIVYMNSTVDYATVNEAVKLAQKNDNRAKGFVNAVLRKIAADVPNDEDIYKELKSKDFKSFITTYYSIGDFIFERLQNNYSSEFIIKLMDSMDNTPNIYIRRNNLKIDNENFLKEISYINSDFEIVGKEHTILKYKTFDRVAKNDLFEKGYYSVQDLGSTKAVLALDPCAGGEVLDLCAAPGGKSIFAAQLMNNKGKVISHDISRAKLNLLDKEAKRLGIDIINTSENDATVYNEDYENKFDRVICDVPCSGIGVMRRKPEIRYKDNSDINDLIKAQYKILENAARYTKNGRILVYSTCTLGREENQDIISRFLSENPKFELIMENEFYPFIDDSDGFYICNMRKHS